jgi:hypothetical protein
MFGILQEPTPAQTEETKVNQDANEEIEGITSRLYKTSGSVHVATITCLDMENVPFARIWVLYRLATIIFVHGATEQSWICGLEGDR